MNHMKRRSFLKTLAATGAGITCPVFLKAETLGLNGRIAPNSRIHVGLIGIGSQGGGHLKALLGAKDFQVTALCEVDGIRLKNAGKRLEQKYGKGAKYLATDDFREVIADSNVDAILCALPDHWHALPVIAAARAGKDIYTEKPFGFSIPEGRAMVNAIQNSGVVCQVGSQQRSGRAFRRAVELVRSGALGQIKRARVTLPPRICPKADLKAEPVPATFNYDMWLGPAPYAPYQKMRCHTYFRCNYDYSGGGLNDWIGHHYDIAAWALNVSHMGPVAIKKAKATFPQSTLYNTAEHYSCEVHYANGVVIELSTVDESLKDFISIGDGGLAIEGEQGWIMASRRGIVYSNQRFRSMPLPSDGIRLDTIPGRGHREDWAACIRTRRQPIAPAHECHRSSTVAALANLAFRTGRSELRFDPIAEKLIDARDAEAYFTPVYRAPWQLPL